MELEKLFKSFLEQIEQEVATNVYSVWFKDLKPVSLNENKFIIQVPMNIHKQILAGNNYKELIDSCFYKLTNKHFEIELLLEDEIKQLDLSTEESKQNIDNDNPQDSNTKFIEKIPDPDWDSNLNPKYTFESFEVGDSNRMAVVSARSVAEHPGTLHNPLFIYGKSGIGKTHLVQAIGNYIKEKTNKRVLYTTSGQFKDDYSTISSISNGIEKIKFAKEFKNKYQNVDVLIIDDIQYWVDADKTQDEFFNTFNALHQAGKQMIITSDSSPDDLKKIEERLRSRLMWGLPVDIYPPDYELRCKIIKRKLRDTVIEDKLNEECIDYIANYCQTDVRFIEGTLNLLLTNIALHQPKIIDLKFVTDSLKGNTNPYEETSIIKIQKAIADYYNITVNDLKSKKKTGNIAKPRHIAIYLCRILTDEGLARIGLEFGGRDHSTVSASIDKITNELKVDKKLNLIVEEIKNKL